MSICAFLFLPLAWCLHPRPRLDPTAPRRYNGHRETQAPVEALSGLHVRFPRGKTGKQSHRYYELYAQIRRKPNLAKVRETEKSTRTREGESV